MIGIAAILVACSGGAGQVVTPDYRTRETQYVKTGCLDPATCGIGGTPAPVPTPDRPGERYCNSTGGDFLDITGNGGTGLSCAGGSGNRTSISGSKCGIDFYMTGGGHSTVTVSGGFNYEGVTGLEINSDDCSYQISF